MEPVESNTTEPSGPLGNRFGRLAAIFAAVILIGLGLNAVFGTDEEPAPTTVTTATEDEVSELGISPADLPRGALAGQEAPPISLVMFDGSTFDLDTHVAEDGRPIVLNFWASWCFPCRTEMPEFDAVAMDRPDVQFIGIAVEDSLAPAQEFAEEIRVSYPLGIDETGQTAAYPRIGLPTTYFINGDGTISRQVQGQLSGALLEALVEFDFG